MRISKLSKNFSFDKELTEIFKVKDITQSCSKNLKSGVGLSDPPSSVIELMINYLDEEKMLGRNRFLLVLILLLFRLDRVNFS